MGTAIIARAEPQLAPVITLAEAVAPVVLTVQSLLRTRTEVAAALRTAQFDVRCVAAWDRLPEAVERITADVVLVDMDVVDRAATESGQLSGHRLVTLLARLLARRPTALVVMTRLDFAEIEDLARAGIHALIPPQTGSRRLAQYIQAALDRVRERHRRASICPVATVPILAGSTTSGKGVPATHISQIAEMLQRFQDSLVVKQLAAPREEAAPPSATDAPVDAPTTPQPPCAQPPAKSRRAPHAASSPTSAHNTPRQTSKVARGDAAL